MCYKYGPRCPSSAIKSLRAARNALSKALTPEAKILAEERVFAATFEYYCTTEGLAYLEKKIQDDPADSDYYKQQLEKARDSRELRISLANNTEEVHNKEEEETMTTHTMQYSAPAPGSAQARRDKGLQVAIFKNGDFPDGMYLDSIASIDEFEQAYQDRLIEVNPHPDPNIPYVVLDYSRTAQFDNAWNDVTINARGLIVNQETGMIVARPFRKFFNYNQPVEGLTEFDRSGPVVVTDKEDGSMGSLYTLPNGKSAISTRGSMNSEQAQRATEIFQDRYAGKWDQNPDTTYIYEIIYPDNRIVLDYGDKEDLILIGGVSRTTGRSLPLHEISEWKGDRAEQYSYGTYSEALAQPISNDREGVVIHFTDSDERLKIKGDHYMHMHRLVSNLTTRRAWEETSKGTSSDWLHELPDEFATPTSAYVSSLRQEHSSRMEQVKNTARKVQQAHGLSDLAGLSREKRKEVVADLRTNYTKREFGQVLRVISEQEDRLADDIWDDMRPEGGKMIDFNTGENE